MLLSREPKLRRGSINGSYCIGQAGGDRYSRSGLKQHTFINLWFWRAGVQHGSRQPKSSAAFLMEALGEDHFLAFSSFWKLLHIPWLLAPSSIFRLSTIGSSPSPTAIALVVHLLPPSSTTYMCLCVYIHIYMGFQVALAVKNLPANTGDVGDEGLIPGSGRSPGGGHGNPLQYLSLENPMDRGAWLAMVHRVAKSWT